MTHSGSEGCLLFAFPPWLSASGLHNREGGERAPNAKNQQKMGIADGEGRRGGGSTASSV